VAGVKAALILAAIYLLRVRVVGRGFEAALTNVLKAVTPPVPAAKIHGVGLRRPWRQAFRRRRTTRVCYRLYLHSGKVTLAVMCLRRVQVVGRSSAAVVTLTVMLLEGG
jgi:hypothetical protein